MTDQRTALRAGPGHLKLRLFAVLRRALLFIGTKEHQPVGTGILLITYPFLTLWGDFTLCGDFTSLYETIGSCSKLECLKSLHLPSVASLTSVCCLDIVVMLLELSKVTLGSISLRLFQKGTWNLRSD